MRRRLGPQVLKLFRGGGATKYLVAVRMAPEALYDASGSLGLRDPELGHRPLVGRSVGRLLLGVTDAALGDLATALNDLYRLSGSARFHEQTVSATGVAAANRPATRNISKPSARLPPAPPCSSGIQADCSPASVSACQSGAFQAPPRSRLIVCGSP